MRNGVERTDKSEGMTRARRKGKSGSKDQGEDESRERESGERESQEQGQPGGAGEVCRGEAGLGDGVWLRECSRCGAGSGAERRSG